MSRKSNITQIPIKFQSRKIKNEDELSHVQIVKEVKTAKRSPLDEILNIDGVKLDKNQVTTLKQFFKDIANVNSRIVRYIGDHYKIEDRDARRISKLLNGGDKEVDIVEGLDIQRFISTLRLLLKNVESSVYENVYGLSNEDKLKIEKMLTFNNYQDMQLEIGYLLRHPDYGVDAVIELITEYKYITVDELPHMKENERILQDQMKLANNPMEGIELLECKSCKQKTFVSGLVSTRAWDETQEVKGTCYNTACALNKK
jgi:hypothetical protein